MRIDDKTLQDLRDEGDFKSLALFAIAKALGRCAEGDTSSACGLEGVGMALAGEHLRSPIGPAISEVSNSLDRIAEAIDGLADVVKNLKIN